MATAPLLGLLLCGVHCRAVVTGKCVGFDPELFTHGNGMAVFSSCFSLSLLALLDLGVWGVFRWVECFFIDH